MTSKKIFLKIISINLVLTLSYSQLLFAADPRQMLLDAKSSFQSMDDTRRSGGTTAEQLSTSQATQESVIDQQNALEDLQNLNFSFTTQNGDILNYVGNTLNQVTRPDGTTLINIQQDTNGNILNADLKLSDGSIQVYENGQVIGYMTPDGSQVIYSNGQIQKVVSKEGLETTYSYVKDAQGKTIQIVAKNSKAATTYDGQGMIQKIEKIDGSKTEFNNGIISKYTNASGQVFTYQVTQTSNGGAKAFISNASPAALVPASNPVISEAAVPVDEYAWSMIGKNEDGSDSFGFVPRNWRLGDIIIANLPGFIEYTVQIPDADCLKFTLETRNNSYSGLPKGYTTYYVKMWVDGQNKGIFAVPATTAWKSFEGVLTGVSSGSHKIRLQWLNDSFQQWDLDSNFAFRGLALTAQKHANPPAPPAASPARTVLSESAIALDEYGWSDAGKNPDGSSLFSTVPRNWGFGDIIGTLSPGFVEYAVTTPKTDRLKISLETAMRGDGYYWVKPYNFTTYYVRLGVDGVDKGVLEMPANTQWTAFETYIDGVSEGSHKIRLEWLNDTYQDWNRAANFYFRNLTLKSQTLSPLPPVLSPDVPSEVLYDASKQIIGATLSDGAKLVFQNGLPKQAVDAQGNATSFSFSQSSLSNILGSQIVQNGLTTKYDETGKLSEVSLSGLTVHYKSNSNNIDFIEQSDGTTLKDLVFDANGQISGAIVTTPSGEERIYAGGALIFLRKPDNTELFYLNNLVTKMTTPEDLTYNFDYTPAAIVATLDTATPAPDALSLVRMEYDSNFNLKKAVRQNQEVLNYLNNSLSQIDVPSQASQVFDYTKDGQGNVLSYTVTQGNVKTFYDASNNPTKAIISPTTDNPHTLEVTYQYGKIRTIKKDGVVTFIYSYSFNDQNEELTTIEDSEENSTKVYKDGLLLTSFDKTNSVLSSYEYDPRQEHSGMTNGSVSSPQSLGGDHPTKVTVSRLGRILHTYNYSYQNDQTIVSDEEGTIRTYNKDKKLIRLEKDGKTWAYSYSLAKTPTGQYEDADLGVDILDHSLIAQSQGNWGGWFWHEDQGYYTTYWAWQWIEYTVNLEEGGDLTLSLDSKNYYTLLPDNYTHFDFEFYVDGVDKGLKEIPATQDAWNNWKITFDGLSKGAHTMRFMWLNDSSDGAGKDANFSFKNLKFTEHRQVYETKEITEEKLLADPATLDPDTVVSSEYSSDGTLETQTKADGTVTLFESGKPQKVLDKDGAILIEYTYDTQGNIQRVYLKNARDTLPDEILKAKEAIEKQRLLQLESLASQKNLAYQSIKSQLDPQRIELETQLSSLQGQFNSISGVSVSGKKAKSQKGDALNQIGHAMDDVRNALVSLEDQQADAYVALDGQVKQVSDQIEADSNKAMDQLAIQQANLQKEILKQEVSPVVYDHYRRILGRDPSGLEYDAWISRVDYDSDGGLLSSPMRFNGSNDFVSIPQSPDFDFGGGDFTIDLEAYFNGFRDNGTLYSKRAEGGSLDNFVIAQVGTDILVGASSNGSTFDILNGASFGASLVADTWYHIAVARSGDNFYGFLNGKKIALGTSSAKIHSNSQPVRIGGDSASGFLNGYIDEFRVSKGVARWTDNFTPSSAPYKADANTVLLLEPAHTGKWMDASFSNHEAAVSGSPVLDGAHRRFDLQNSNITLPTAPVRFDGNADYLSIPDNSDWNFGSGDFTMETWVYFNSLAANGTLYSKRAAGGNLDNFVIAQVGTDILVGASSNGTSFDILNSASFGASLVTGRWYHIAVARSGGDFYGFLDGTKVNLGSSAAAIKANSQNARLGGDSDASWLNGYLDEFRISKGLARWTGDFTPLRAPYIPDPNTCLLLGTDSQGRLIDRSPSHHAISPGGPARVDTQRPHFSGQILSEALSDYVNASPELKDRRLYVRHIKTAVANLVNQYLAKSQGDKEAYAASLGLSPGDLIALSSADAQKILTWLNSRSLHFGQSAFLALEALLESSSSNNQNPSSPNSFVGDQAGREALATKCILIDILTGVISPLDDGDLVISMFALNKVAGLYGVNLSGANLSWDDLSVILRPQAEGSQSVRVIAHINGNHYVVITGITQDTITYIDPGAGQDKQNQVETVTKAQFMKGWKGNVTCDSGLLNPVIAASSQKAVPTARLLNQVETQKIRGAFFFFLIPLFISFAASIGGAVASVIAGIGTILAGVGTIVAGALSSIGGFLATVAQGIGYIGSAIWQGISFAASSLWGALGNIGSFLSQNIFGSIAKAGFGNTLFQNVVNTGIRFAVSKGLESLGVNPTITSLVSSFVGGGNIGSFNPSFTAQSFIQAGIKNLALQGSQTLLQKIGLDTTLTQTLSLITTPLIDGIQSGNIGTNFVKIIPDLAKNLSFYGIQKLGTSLGLNSQIAGLVAAPIAGALNAGFVGGKDVGANIISAVNQGLTSGIVKYGLNFIGNSSPILGSLLSPDVQANVEAAIGRNGLFQGIFNILSKTVLNVFNVVGGAVQTVFQGITDFGFLIQQKGLVGALQSLTTSIFSRSAQESILNQGGMQNILNLPKTPTTLPDGKPAQEIKINDTNSIYLDTNGNLLGFKKDGAIQEGSFGVNGSSFGLIAGQVQAFLQGNLKLTTSVVDGQAGEIVIKDSNGNVVLQADPEKAGDVLLIEGPDLGQSSSFWNTVLNFASAGLSVIFKEGTANAANIAISVGTQATGLVDIALLNGITPKLSGNGTLPDYFKSGNPFRQKLNNLGVNDNSITAIPLYQNGVVQDIWDWLVEKQVEYTIWNSFKNIYNAQSGKSFVPLAYSGAGRPLLAALNDPTYRGFGIETAILVGTPMNLWETRSFSQSLKRVINIYGSNDLFLGVQDQPAIAPFFVNNGHSLETINIELKDVDHGEYFYQNGSNPTPEQIKASNFIARLTQASLSVNGLNDLLALAGVATITYYTDPSTGIQHTIRSYIIDTKNLPSTLS